jgi:ATP-dependent protease ClpP protease subunit
MFRNIITLIYILFSSLLIRSIDSTDNVEHKKIHNDKPLIITLEPNNFIAIDDTINDDNYLKWLNNLSTVASENDTIYIYIDSNGGDVESGNKFINQLNYYSQIGKSIKCIAKNAYSMAFQIFQSSGCHKRYILSSSTTMQHQFSLNNIKGQLINTMNYLKMIETMSKSLDQQSANRIGISYDEYFELTKNDWWLYGEDIISKGVADNLVTIGCDHKLFSSFYNIIVEDVQITEEGLISIKEKKIKKNLCPL